MRTGTGGRVGMGGEEEEGMGGLLNLEGFEGPFKPEWGGEKGE